VFFFVATVLGTVATASPVQVIARALHTQATAATPGSSAAAFGPLVPTGTTSMISAVPARVHLASPRPHMPQAQRQRAAALQGTEPQAAALRAGIANAKSLASADSDFTSIFTPLPLLPAAVKAPSVKEAAAFAALNALLDTETRFGEAVVAIGVSLDRALAAASAGAQLWLVRQANASAEYALSASRLLGRFPALQAAMVRGFVADRMTLTLTAAQFAAARAKLRRGLPASFTHLLAVAAAAYQPTTVPEVAALRAAILDTGAIEQALAHMAPRALALPAVLASSAVTAPEVRLAAALEHYANSILQPVPARALGGMARRLEPDAMFAAAEGPGEAVNTAGEAFHGLHEAFEGASAGAKTFGGEAATGAAEGLEPLGEALGLAFAGVAFYDASQAFGDGAGEGAGEGGGSSSAASYGDPHQMTFSGSGYDFQATGEFTLVKSTTDDLDIQVRQQAFPGTGDIAVDSATAMRVGDSAVELAAKASGDLQLWVNHQAVGFASRALTGGGKISVLGPGSATVTWPDGTAVSVYSTVTSARTHETTCNGSDALNLTITVPPSRVRHLEGLLGDPGAPAGELVGGNGVTYSMDELATPWESVHNFDVLYHQFAQSWRVSQRASLFYYPKGTSTTSFTDLAFPSRALTVASLSPTSVATAERICKAAGITNRDLLADCVYDVGVTGGSGSCFAAADARVQAATGGPRASGLPESSGTIPPSSATTTSPQSTTTSSQPTTTTSPGMPPPAGSGAPLAVGSGTGAPPALAVDAAGTAYVVWQQSSTRLSFCGVANSPASCSPVMLEVAEPAQEEFFGTPSVLLAPGRIYVLDGVIGGSDDLEGIDEFVSTDGGASFSLEPHAVGLVGGDSAPAGPAVELPGGDFGAGYVIPESNPAFQANSLAAPTDQSAGTTPPFATLNPGPASAYTVGSLGGVFGSQLVGSPGVLGVFEAFPGKGYSPCPSSASAALVYAYAAISASTTPAELSTSPGGSSPWRPLAKVDCDGTDPAVGGGPSGLGLLETDEASGSHVQYRHFSPSSGFGPAVTIASDEVASDGTLSQDRAGGIFATWLDSSTGVELAYSSDGGASWSKPKTLFSNAGNPSGISLLVSAVDTSGQGWAVYAVGKREYAQRFS
jgi:hypothetical protein